MTATIRDVLARAVSLEPVSESARLDIELLLAHCLNTSRALLYAWPEKELSPEQLEVVDSLLQRRLSGEPIAYLLGSREFWSLNLLVTPAVLIPRPETELLVELALEKLSDGEHAGEAVADLGTGSGAIALALASERPGQRIVAVDCSPDALAVARMNAVRLELAVELREGFWCEGLPPDERFYLIVSNPPYLAAEDPHLRRGDLRFEPSSALVADAQGLADICLIAEGSRDHLLPGGWLLLEHGFEQGRAVRDILRELDYEAVESHRDLAGHERVTLGRFDG